MLWVVQISQQEFIKFILPIIIYFVWLTEINFTQDFKEGVLINKAAAIFFDWVYQLVENRFVENVQLTSMVQHIS